MAAKTCTADLVKTFMRLRPFPLQSCGYSTVQKPCLPANVGGASVHSLPGHRLFLQPLPCCWQRSWRMKSTQLADNKISRFLGVPGIEELDDFTPLTDKDLQTGVGEQINKSLEEGEAGRLFAVVYVRGIQHKVTPEDVIVVKHDFPPNVGDKIRLEKVLTVGGKNFSLVGQPLLSRDVVRVDATVVEKTLSHNRVWFVYRKRSTFKKFHLYREHHTVLLINSIQVARISQEADTEDDTEKTGGSDFA